MFHLMCGNSEVSFHCGILMGAHRGGMSKTEEIMLGRKRSKVCKFSIQLWMKCKTLKSFPEEKKLLTIMKCTREMYLKDTYARSAHIKCSNFLVFLFSLAVNLQGFILNYNLIFVLFNEFNQTSVVSSYFSARFFLSFFPLLRVYVESISNYDGFSALFTCERFT